MKIECIREKLWNAVAMAEKMTGKNKNFPILSSLLLVVKNNFLIIKSTNLDIGSEIEVPVKMIKEGSLAVPASVLNMYLASIQNEKNVTLEEEGGNLKIYSSKNFSTIKTIPSEEYPVIPRTESGVDFRINSEDLITGFKSVWYAAGTSSMKPEIGSVFIWSEAEKLIFAATDSFRLAEKKILFKDFKDISGLLVPFKNVSEIIKVLENIKGEVLVSYDKNQISFKGSNVYIVSRLVGGSFPDYKQIIPKTFETEINVLKQDLINSLKTSSIFTDKLNQITLSIRTKEKKLEIETHNSDLGESKNTVLGSFEGEDVQVSFNYKYIIDSFQSISPDSVFLGFNGTQRPVLIKGSSDASFVYVAMPMNR